MGLRASDEDRERTVEFLRSQQQLGRLTVDELEERIAAALAAKEVTELGGLVADLPPAPPRPAAPPAPRRGPRVPGRFGFSERWSAPIAADDAMAELIVHVAPAMRGFGYDLVERTPHRLVFELSRTPGWVIIPCVLLFPIGFVSLLVKTRERVTVEIVERGGETVFLASGTAPLRVRRAFAELEA